MINNNLFTHPHSIYNTVLLLNALYLLVWHLYSFHCLLDYESALVHIPQLCLSFYWDLVNSYSSFKLESFPLVF